MAQNDKGETIGYWRPNETDAYVMAVSAARTRHKARFWCNERRVIVKGIRCAAPRQSVTKSSLTGSRGSYAEVFVPV